MRDHEIFTLPNGIRIVYKQISNSKIAHCGYVLDIGSRDEGAGQQGLAHFWEHMAFKGTRKRKAFHILNRLDSVGGELNAFTTKEKICFYASVLDKHLEKALELLTDITFDSVFPENQIEKERNVILEEMAMYRDNPEDAIQDDFDHLLFPDHPLGHNILGTPSTVNAFTRKDFRLFIKQHLNTDRLVFSCVANWPASKVIKLCEKYLSDLRRLSGSQRAQKGIGYIPRTRIVKKDITQSHCGMGRLAYSIMEEKKLPFTMLVNLLGGPAMNSRLNMALRERHGFVYGIDANYSPFADTGMFSIFFATDKRLLYKSLDLVLKELRTLKTRKLSALQLHKIKEQFIGQMAMSEEHNTSLMLMMGRSLIDQQRIQTFEEITDLVRSTTAEELLDISNEIFDENEFSFLYFVPRNNSATRTA